MQKQFLLAIVLSFLVIYGWQALFPPAKKVPPMLRALLKAIIDSGKDRLEGVLQL